MIDFVRQTPRPYRESRDYQLISKLYDVLFNSSRSYSDIIKAVQQGEVVNLSGLKSLTVNFNPSHEWVEELLSGISNSFNYILKSKGTVSAIKYCINILLRLQGIPTNHEVIITTGENMEALFSGNLAKSVDSLDDPGLTTNYLYIIIPRFLIKQGLIQDLLNVLLPVGVSYRVIETELIDRTWETYVEITTQYPEYFGIYGIRDKYLTISENDLPTKANVTDPKYPKDINKLNIPGRQIMYNKVIENDSEAEPNE